jgi:hypothetical protein
VATGIARQAELFLKRYLNSLTIGSTVSINEMQRQIQSSSDLIRSSFIRSFNSNGRDLPLEDYSIQDVRYFPSAGNVTVSAAIIGVSEY